MRYETKIIDPNFFPQHEIDAGKVFAIIDDIQKNGQTFPIIVIDYDGRFMPIDGHHRLSACKHIGIQCKAIVFNSDDFDQLCMDVGSMEADNTVKQIAAGVL